MLPLRLTLLLIGVLIAALIAVGNPDPVTVQFIFWSEEIAMYKLILGSMAFGVIMAILYIGHVRHVRRHLGDRFRR